MYHSQPLDDEGLLLTIPRKQLIECFLLDYCSRTELMNEAAIAVIQSIAGFWRCDDSVNNEYTCISVKKS